MLEFTELFIKGVIKLSLKEILDNRVRKYRAKYLKPPKEVVEEFSERCAKVTWNFLKIIMFVSQRQENQVVVYLGIKTYPEARGYAFVHKLTCMGFPYTHLYPLKYPQETLKKVRELAEKEGLRVVEADHFRDKCEGEMYITWKIHIVYDVPEK